MDGLGWMDGNKLVKHGQLRVTSPVNTNALAGENGFSMINGPYLGRLRINPKKSNGLTYRNINVIAAVDSIFPVGNF